MICPDCDAEALEYNRHEWSEDHGEHCSEEVWECHACGEIYSDRELQRAFEANAARAKELINA